MAKLRRNHSSRGSSAAASTILKLCLFVLILLGLLWGVRKFWAGTQVQREYAGEAYYLPSGGKGQIIEHGGFVLSYDEEWEQAEWVAYILDGDDLARDWTKRRNNFRSDPAVARGSARDDDYRGSGYDRGHLAPFADFAYSETLADQTFYMSNVSPQARQFNQGIWRELEETVRDWARRDRQLYVVTGPVTTEDPKGYVGRKNRVAIPQRYYKVLLDLEEPRQKAIAFLMPNEVSFDPLPEYAVSIDEVERITGLDFFADLMPRDLERELEASSNPDFWLFDKKKYDRRIDKWNQVK